MADGFHIELDRDLAERLADAAALAGMTPETYAVSVLGDALRDPSGVSEPGGDGWAEDLAALDEYDRTGIAKPFRDVMDRIEAKIRAKLAERP